MSELPGMRIGMRIEFDPRRKAKKDLGRAFELFVRNGAKRDGDDHRIPSGALKERTSRGGGSPSLFFRLWSSTRKRPRAMRERRASRRSAIEVPSENSS